MAREWRLKARPEGLPGPECFELAETALAPLAEGELRVANRWLSVDPYMRGRMVDRPSYIPPFQLGAPLSSRFLHFFLDVTRPFLNLNAQILARNRRQDNCHHRPHEGAADDPGKETQKSVHDKLLLKRLQL